MAAQAELSVDSYLERLDAICKEMIREEVKRFIEKNSAGLLTQLIKDYLDEDLKNVIDDMVHRCCRCGGLLREGKTKSGEFFSYHVLHNKILFTCYFQKKIDLVCNFGFLFICFRQ